MSLESINIESLLKSYSVTGFSMALIENGELKKDEQYGLLKAGKCERVDRNSLFNACSISKVCAAILVLKLAEDGVLHIDEDVNKYLVSWKLPQTTMQKVTLRHLLSHQSGISDPDGSFAEWQPYGKIPLMAELLSGQTVYCARPIEISYEAGSDFRYSDAGYCVIQQIVEDATGRSFEDLAIELVFQPLDMYSSMFFQHPPKAMTRNIASGHDQQGQVIQGDYPIYPYPASSGLWTTPSDLAKLVIEMIHALRGDSKIGLSAESISDMIKSQGNTSWAGLGVFLEGTGDQVEVSSLGWGVGFQSMLVAYPQKGTALIMMTNTDSGIHQLKGMMGKIYYSLADFLQAEENK